MELQYSEFAFTLHFASDSQAALTSAFGLFKTHVLWLPRIKPPPVDDLPSHLPRIRPPPVDILRVQRNKTCYRLIPPGRKWDRRGTHVRLLSCRRESCETRISSKWRGSVRMAMKSPAESVWKLGADFLGLKKWLPYIDICRHVDGEENAVGCVRYCSGREISSTDNQKAWVEEKLLSMDDRYYSYTYGVIDGNLGMDGYVASFRLCHVGDGSAVVEWSFEANPSEHCTEQQFVEVMSSHLGKMIRWLDEAAATLG